MSKEQEEQTGGSKGREQEGEADRQSRRFFVHCEGSFFSSEMMSHLRVLHTELRQSDLYL